MTSKLTESSIKLVCLQGDFYAAEPVSHTFILVKQSQNKPIKRIYIIFKLKKM